MKSSPKNLSSLRKILSLKNISRHPSGQCCTFVQLTKKVGVKMFKYKYERTFSLRKQRVANRLGFGPAVGDSFEIRMDGVNYACYFTEVAITQDMEEIWDRPSYDKDIRVLNDFMEKYKFDVGDLYSEGNVGYLGNKLVCVDFDPVSMTP